ncbi:MAG: hypothetical protein PHU23_12610, partial [Dehalococcoidales bacterium]|nr:hypothetical protein [Dehalococcoidales bacterium]
MTIHFRDIGLARGAQDLGTGTQVVVTGEDPNYFVPILNSFGGMIRFAPWPPYDGDPSWSGKGMVLFVASLDHLDERLESKVEWIRDRDQKVLSTFSYTLQAPAYGYYYNNAWFWAYILAGPDGVWEDGWYTCRYTYKGNDGVAHVVDFGFSSSGWAKFKTGDYIQNNDDGVIYKIKGINIYPEEGNWAYSVYSFDTYATYELPGGYLNNYGQLLPGFVPTWRITTSIGASGGAIAPAGPVYVRQGSGQTFTFTPNTGYKIDKIYIDGVNKGAISYYTINNVTATHQITAYFKVDSFTINASAGVGGRITPSGNVTVPRGGSQNFIISANPGYKIKNVRIGGLDKGPLTSYTFTNVTSNQYIGATFEVYTPKFKVGDKIAYLGDVVNQAVLQILEVLPEYVVLTGQPGAYLVEVITPGQNNLEVGSQMYMDFFSSDADDQLVDYPMFFTIRVNVGPGGRVNYSGDISIDRGASIDFVVTPNRGYVLQNVMIDGISLGAAATFALNQVDRNHLVEVSFMRYPTQFTTGDLISEGGLITKPILQVLSIQPDYEYGAYELMCLSPGDGTVYGVGDIYYADFLHIDANYQKHTLGGGAIEAGSVRAGDSAGVNFSEGLKFVKSTRLWFSPHWVNNSQTVYQGHVDLY